MGAFLKDDLKNNQKKGFFYTVSSKFISTWNVLNVFLLVFQAMLFLLISPYVRAKPLPLPAGAS